MSEEYSGFDLTMYNLFTLLREMYYTRGETETSFLQKSGGTITGSVTIQGNLVVNGQSYSIDTENLKVGDYTITLAKDNEQTLTSMVGMVVPKYDGTNYGFFGWDADGYAYVGDLTNYDGTSAITLANNSSLQRISTIDTTNTVVASNGVIYVYDATSHCFKKPTNDNKYYVIRNGAFVETELFTEQKSKNIDNALYHLGAFDTISGNTITRQTGILILDEQNWNYLTDYDRPRYEITLSSAVLPSNNDGMPLLVCNNYEVKTPNTAWSDKSGVSLDPNAKLIVYGTTKPSGKLEYKLSSGYQYQDNIIPNQPLLNLDSNGCNWLQNEWEKGLNLFDYNKTSEDSSHLRFFITNIKKSGTYYFSANSSIGRVEFYKWSGSGNPTSKFGDYNNVSGQSVQITSIDNSYPYVVVYLSNSGNYSYDFSGYNIMLNSGTHAYPYQEYNGAIVREKDIEPVLLWENSSPNDALAGQTITTKTMSKKYIIVGAKYYKDNVWGTQFFKFAREDVNYYCQIGTFFRLITITSNTSITITNNKDITSEQDANNNNLVITSISETNVL